MFVDEKTHGEAAPAQVGTLKLSEAIREGCPWVKETMLFSGCAIGTGYRVLTGRDLTEDWRASGSSGNATRLVAEAFNIPSAIVSTVSGKHFEKQMTREECADWLESNGY